MIENQNFGESETVTAGLNTLARYASRLGFSIVDIAGFLDDVDKMSASQQGAVRSLSGQAHVVLKSNQSIQDTLDKLMSQTSANAQTAMQAAKNVEESSAQTRNIADWVKGLSEQMSRMADAVKTAQNSNEQIASIAAQVNILAVNAKIEAARAGSAGRGFAVVAEAINELSGKTARAAKDISDDIAALNETITALTSESHEISEQADAALDGIGTITQATDEMAQRASNNAEKTSKAKDEAAQVAGLVGRFLPEFDKIGTTVTNTANGVHQVSRQVNGLVDLTETIVQQTVALGGLSEDRKFIDRVQADAAKISSIWEDALARGKISEEKLFSRTYQEIQGTNPQQVLAPYTLLGDELLPPVLEAALACDPRVVFCSATDTCGLLSTHNKKYSHPQGDDPVWNAANCRNRRLFDDRVGLKAGRSKEPFLLQVYRRDMGGGEFVLMKDVSSPITINGRHWGGLRLAYRVYT